MLYFLKNQIKKDDKLFVSNKALFRMPSYDPNRHYLDLASSHYYKALITLRHYVKSISDYYFGSQLGAKNIDLFMLSLSVSSPVGPGSNSQPIKIKLGKIETNLVDSSQFGLEPLLLNEINKVYCYLPSMRGENPDSRHLNQFFHCEMEMRGLLNQLIPIIEGYVKILCKTLLSMENIIERISTKPKATRQSLNKILATKKFKRITFDEAVEILIKNNKRKYINCTKHGRDISSKGEIALMKILKADAPLWVMYYDRNRVAFYQKPDPKNPNKTINADLLFPPISKGCFGGEIVGSGQRQDNSKEMYESLRRQNNISTKPYEWYINLRKLPNYKTTSGFGMGIERFIAWALGKNNIRDVIIYPRLKNIKTYP